MEGRVPPERRAPRAPFCDSLRELCARSTRMDHAMSDRHTAVVSDPPIFVMCHGAVRGRRAQTSRDRAATPRPGGVLYAPLVHMAPSKRWLGKYFPSSPVGLGAENLRSAFEWHARRVCDDFSWLQTVAWRLRVVTPLSLRCRAGQGSRKPPSWATTRAVIALREGVVLRTVIELAGGSRDGTCRDQRARPPRVRRRGCGRASSANTKSASLIKSRKAVRQTGASPLGASRARRSSREEIDRSATRTTVRRVVAFLVASSSRAGVAATAFVLFVATIHPRGRLTLALVLRTSRCPTHPPSPARPLPLAPQGRSRGRHRSPVDRGWRRRHRRARSLERSFSTDEQATLSSLATRFPIPSSPTRDSSAPTPSVPSPPSSTPTPACSCRRQCALSGAPPTSSPAGGGRRRQRQGRAPRARAPGDSRRGSQAPHVHRPRDFRECFKTYAPRPATRRGCAGSPRRGGRDVHQGVAARRAPPPRRPPPPRTARRSRKSPRTAPWTRS